MASKSALNPLTKIWSRLYNRGVVDNKAGSSGVSSTDPTPNPTGDVTTGRAASIVAQKGKDDKALECYRAASPAGYVSGEAARFIEQGTNQDEEPPGLTEAEK